MMGLVVPSFARADHDGRDMTKAVSRRYHFDLSEDGLDLADESGLLLPDDVSATAHARRILCDIARDGSGASYRVDVRGMVGGHTVTVRLDLVAD